MLPAAAALITVLGLVVAGEQQQPMETADQAPAQPAGKVEKPAAEWRQQLTPEQFRVLREAGTERPFGEVYQQFKHQGSGTYYCAGCGAELFSSKHKFDSGCGWPSFYDPANAKNVLTRTDVSLGAIRTEVVCARCGGHLGHVFDGEGFPTPTDQRYCINGVTLKFVPDQAARGTARAPAAKPE
jgi:peptide-methionine (R)-S-oxide reductase